MKHKIDMFSIQIYKNYRFHTKIFTQIHINATYNSTVFCLFLVRFICSLRVSFVSFDIRYVSFMLKTYLSTFCRLFLTFSTLSKCLFFSLRMVGGKGVLPNFIQIVTFCTFYAFKNYFLQTVNCKLISISLIWTELGWMA